MTLFSVRDRIDETFSKIIASNFLISVVTYANNEIQNNEKIHNDEEFKRRIKKVTRSYLCTRDNLSVSTMQYGEPRPKGMGHVLLIHWL